MNPPAHETGRRERIGSAFAAATAYDANARIQADAARALAARIAALPLCPGPRMLELGCGTGFLTAALVGTGFTGQALVTDLAPAMIERARARIGDRPGVTFAPLDGEHGAMPGEGPFDLIAASLAAQWFDDLPAALARLSGWLRPGGWLALTTLTEGTFAEWRAAHEALGLRSGTPAYPSAQALAAMLPGAELTLEPVSEVHVDARDFLRAVKAIGAGTPAPGHRPLGPGPLRAVMRRFERDGARATYQIATLLWQRPPMSTLAP
ncbi:methyltransferase domain-containing protein [Novosphingobium flavum]|uniref:Methyltransferase domain-containing protein n=1 Tax=Novosphingobium flavum TaxID=1778672 RepID=A0A7X1KNA2_9SPHN|nr:methyltransferase [Novosphingobium flavum]MBC2667437.1 methyltransferase domain-containing protein [Novosphingobium flavum]